MFDEIVTDLRDMFTTTPDYSPYAHQDSDHRVFVESKAYRVDDPKYRERRFMRQSADMDDPEYIGKLRQGNVPHKSGP
jgi:hypothetical protein